jgi:hypothetical protein
MNINYGYIQSMHILKRLLMALMYVHFFEHVHGLSEAESKEKHGVLWDPHAGVDYNPRL